MTHSDLEHLITKVTGTSPLSLERLTFGHSNEVYDVALPDRNVVLRLNANPIAFPRFIATAMKRASGCEKKRTPSLGAAKRGTAAKMFAGTAPHLLTFDQLGFPVPRLLYADLSLTKYPVAFVVLEKLPGSDLRNELAAMTRPQMTMLAQTIIGFQRQVTKFPRGQGFGWTYLGQAAPFKTWRDVVRRDLGATKAVMKRKGYVTAWAAAHGQFEQCETYLETVPATCFLDDLTTKNVLVKGGKLTGLVDFDWVCYGDPLYWLALIQTAVISDIRTEGQFYVQELKRFWNLSSEQTRVIDTYAALHTLDFLCRKQDEDAEKRLLAAVDEWLEF